MPFWPLFKKWPKITKKAKSATFDVFGCFVGRDPRNTPFSTICQNQGLGPYGVDLYFGSKMTTFGPPFGPLFDPFLTFLTSFLTPFSALYSKWPFLRLKVTHSEKTLKERWSKRVLNDPFGPFLGSFETLLLTPFQKDMPIIGHFWTIPWKRRSEMTPGWPKMTTFGGNLGPLFDPFWPETLYNQQSFWNEGSQNDLYNDPNQGHLGLKWPKWPKTPKNGVLGVFGVFGVFVKTAKMTF